MFACTPDKRFNEEKENIEVCKHFTKKNLEK